jgi:hypothetical protein
VTVGTKTICSTTGFAKFARKDVYTVQARAGQQSGQQAGEEATGANDHPVH